MIYFIKNQNWILPTCDSFLWLCHMMFMNMLLIHGLSCCTKNGETMTENIIKSVMSLLSLLIRIKSILTKNTTCTTCTMWTVSLLNPSIGLNFWQNQAYSFGGQGLLLSKSYLDVPAEPPKFDFLCTNFSPN